MRNIYLLLLIVLCSLQFSVKSSFASTSYIDSDIDRVDWPNFMAKHDMVWSELPSRWYEAPFLGNGEQGTLLYKLDNKTLHWDVGCSSAHEHRSMQDDDFSEKNFTALNRGRHFIGHIELQLPEEIEETTARLSLWNAETNGTFISNSGKMEWSTLVHATQAVMRFTFCGEGDLKNSKMLYIPEEARNPRSVRSKAPRKPVNSSPIETRLDDGVVTSVHNLAAGGQTAVAYKKEEHNGTTTIWLSVKHSYPGSDAVDLAVSAVRDAVSEDQECWINSHRDWWHSYYPKSFVSVGDDYWDSFYWIQQYKLACATRDKGWIIDNQGPWLQPTAWCATWWNLNVQLSHSGGYTANRRGMVSAMSHQLDKNRDMLALNVAEPYRHDSYAIGRNSSGWDLQGHAGQPGGREPIEIKIGSEVGNLLWALHNVDMEYLYWKDSALRDSTLYPLLTRAVNYYRHFLVENEEGKLSIPATFSPEYKMAEDCTYDVDLLYWGVSRLLTLAKEKGLSAEDEPLIVEWQDIESRLVKVAIDDEKGRVVGKGVTLDYRHRHWSHLLAIYPLRTLTPDSYNNRKIIDQGLTHWHSFGRAMGYSFTGGACMAALLNDGNRALDLLEGLRSFLQPNTFYSEIGLPVMETPLHGATAMQDMLLQSWGNRLRVFPGMPDKWADASFHKLRGEGAFLVSALRKDRLTEWVVVKSEQAGVVELDSSIDSATFLASEGSKVKRVEGNIFELDMRAGSWVVFWKKGEPKPEIEINSTPSSSNINYFGL